MEWREKKKLEEKERKKLMRVTDKDKKKFHFS